MEGLKFYDNQTPWIIGFCTGCDYIGEISIIYNSNENTTIIRPIYNRHHSFLLFQNVVRENVFNESLLCLPDMMLKDTVINNHHFQSLHVTSEAMKISEFIHGSPTVVQIDCKRLVPEQSSGWNFYNLYPILVLGAMLLTVATTIAWTAMYFHDDEIKYENRVPLLKKTRRKLTKKAKRKHRSFGESQPACMHY